MTPIVAVAEKPAEKEPGMSALAKKLEDKDLKVRLNTAQQLRDAALKGQNTPVLVLPTLIKILNDKDEDSNLKGLVAQVLTLHYLNKENKKNIAELFNHKDFRRSVLKALWDAAWNRRDISFFMPTLVRAFKEGKNDMVDVLTLYYLNKGDGEGIRKLLSHKDERVRWDVIVTLGEAARKGRDIGLVASALLAKVFEEKDAATRIEAIDALVSYYLKRKNKSGIEKLLNHKDDNIRRDTARVLSHAAKEGEKMGFVVAALAAALRNKKNDDYIRRYVAEALENIASNGQDITRAILALTGAVNEDKDEEVKRHTSRALTYHYTNKIIELLNHPDSNVREEAAQAQKEMKL